MTKSTLGNQIVCQVAIIVHDIEKTSRAWAEVLGVEPPSWRATGTAEETRIAYHGESTDARAKLAFLDMGQVRLELIEPVGRPSTWGEFLDEHGQGIHHIAFHVKGMDQVLAGLAAQGIPLVQSGQYTGGEYAYVDAVSELGGILELLENH